MTWKLIRKEFSPNGVFGEMWNDANAQVAVTLEHSYTDPQTGDITAKLPEGTYTCVRGTHMLHSGPIVTFEITGVPGHSGILIHPGNTMKDSEGCVLVGQTISGSSITDSRSTFGEIMNELKGIDSFTLEVTNV